MIRFFHALTFTLLFFSTNLQAQVPPELQAKWDREHAVPENPLLEHRPSALPDRIIITPLADNNDEIAITWRTDTSVKEGMVEIISGDSLSFPKENRERYRTTYHVVQSKDHPMHYHRAVVTEKYLKAGTIYKYRVGNPPQWSPWLTYRHQEFKDTVKFLYFGDTQNGIYDHTTKIYKQAFNKFDDAQLAIHVGDLINHANNDYEWSEWHAATNDINTSVPVIATPGNHEYLKNLEGSKIQLSSYWTTVFPYPYKWDAGSYFFDYGFVRLVVLNSNEKVDEQGRWLDSLLSKTQQPWVILVSHHPVFSGARKRLNKGLQDNWLPVIKKYQNKIGLVLQGHDHTYARGGLPGRRGTVNKPQQPVFTVTVIGDKRYSLNRQDWMDIAYADVSSYQYIVATRNKIIYKAFSETGTLIDCFEIEK